MSSRITDPDQSLQLRFYPFRRLHPVEQQLPFPVWTRIERDSLFTVVFWCAHTRWLAGDPFGVAFSYDVQFIQPV
jgi:hypothetical protein